MKISVTKEGDLELKEVYNSIVLITEDKDTLAICMRDTGFEFKYGDNWYSAQGGLVTKMMFSPDEQETKKKKG